MLAGASRAFAAAPYSEVTTAGLAECCEASEGLIFHYFGSKAGLYAAVVGEAPEDQPTPAFGEKASKAPEPFDPASAKIDDVLAYVATADDAEKARIIEAEKAGKARKTLLEKLEG